MRPCDAPCGLWAGCEDEDCEGCPIAPEIMPGEPGRDEDQDDQHRGVGAPDPDVRVSPR